MSLVYSEADYHGIIDDNYRLYPFHAARAEFTRGQWQSLQSSALLIAGCGWGFTVRILMEQWGFTDVWGCDASEYAVNVAAPRELPTQYADRVLLGDVTDDTSMRNVCAAADIKGGNPRFRAVLTEDVLPCMDSEAEALQALSVLRGRSQGMAHIITPAMSGGALQPDGSVTYPGGVQMPGFLWRSIPEWRALIGSGEPIYDTHTRTVEQS